MKIVDVSTTCLSRMHGIDEQWETLNFRAIKADAVVVRVTTDEGIVGIAEPSPYGVPMLIAENVARLAPEVIGLDPLEASKVGLHPNGVSAAHDCAVAGIDAALWDIRGKIENKRVADLLRAEGARRLVTLYASGGCNYDWRRNPEKLIEEVVGYKARGFTASKVRLGTEWAWDFVTPKRQLELLGALRNAVGDDYGLMLDAKLPAK